MDIRLQMFNAVRQGFINAAMRMEPDLDGKILDVFVQPDGSVNVVDVGMYDHMLKIEPGAAVALLNDIKEFETIAHMFNHVSDAGGVCVTIDPRVQLGEDVRDVLFSHVRGADEDEEVFLQYQEDGSILVVNQDSVPIDIFLAWQVKEFLDADERTNKFVERG